MTPTRKRRLYLFLSLFAGVSLAVAIAMYALQDNLLYFQSPSDVVSKQIASGEKFRLGGLVQRGTVKRDPQTLLASFDVTDGKQTIHVEYQGILPDLFAEGQGVIAHGRLTSDDHFVADDVLAKHDETYMAPEVADALERAGHPVKKKISDSTPPVTTTPDSSAG
ncbi:MAG: cytochrome c maturation protein CcmE [Gammaproteobacteria bacterium]|jgi:cytochrome c-type biogenesis protein CcmE|nr:cytochrome c maturation protein CcmE [Gammaproteobacteria bacterium]